MKKIKQILSASRRVRGRRVRLLPLLMCFLLVSMVAADLILRYQLGVETDGGNVLINSYSVGFFEADGITPCDTIMYPDVVIVDQMGAKFTPDYVLKLLYPDTVDVYVDWSFDSALPTGLTSLLYLDGMVEFISGVPIVLNTANPSVVLKWSLEADQTAIAGTNMAGIGVTFDASEYYNPVAVAASVAQPSADCYVTLIQGDPTHEGSWSIAVNDGYSPEYYFHSDLATQNFYWFDNVPTDVTIELEFSTDSGVTWTILDQATAAPFNAGGTLYRWHVVISDPPYSGDYPVNLAITWSTSP